MIRSDQGLHPERTLKIISAQEIAQKAKNDSIQKAKQLAKEEAKKKKGPKQGAPIMKVGFLNWTACHYLQKPVDHRKSDGRIYPAASGLSAGAMNSVIAHVRVSTDTPSIGTL